MRREDRFSGAAALIVAIAMGALAGCASSLEQGAASMARGDYDGAASWYRHAIEENPADVGAYINLGIAYNRGRRFAYALPVLGRAVQLAPQSAWAHYNLAYTLQYLGRPADALAEYGATASLDPGCVHCAYAMGGLFFQVGDLQRSLVTLNGYLAAARSVPAEARFIRSAFALRNEAGRRLAFAEAERQRALPVAPPAPDFAPREERAPEPSPPVSVAPGPSPLVRPPSADTAKHDQAIEAIFESVGGEVARRDGEERGGGWGVFEQIVGMAFRNDGIEKGLALAFPQLSDEARQYLEPLVISVFEGKLAPRDLAEAEFRSLAVDELKGRFKDEAQVIGIVDFLWDVKVKAARR